MFSQKLCLALLTLSLSSFSAQAMPFNFGDLGNLDFGHFGNSFNHNQQSCDVSSATVSAITTTATVTVTAGGSPNETNAPPPPPATVTITATALSPPPATVTVTAGAPPTETSAPPPSNNSGGDGNNGGNNNNDNGDTGNNGGDTGNNGGDTGNNGGDTGNNGGDTGNDGGVDPQTSLTLDPRVIAPAFANDGQDVPTEGQVASLTSTNNFINFCLTVDVPITNGQQIKTGSCNPAPIGVIPSTDNMPSSKFAFPTNFGTLQANTDFTIKMNVQNMETGFFVNANENYFAAPQVLNAQGQIQGHSHVIIEKLDALDQSTPTDPRVFAFFKGLNAKADNGALTADVPGGLESGFYRLSSINAASNHQPVIVPVAQHGFLDDHVYFTITDDGKPLAGTGNGNGNNGNDNQSATASAVESTAASTASSSAADSTAASTASSSAADSTAASTASSSAADSTAASTASSSAADSTAASTASSSAADSTAASTASSSAADSTAAPSATEAATSAAQGGSESGDASQGGGNKDKDKNGNGNGNDRSRRRRWARWL